MKFTVREISNGWIVLFHSTGKSFLKEPYEKLEYYVENIKELPNLIKEVTGTENVTENV